VKRFDFWDEESGEPMLPEIEEHGRFVYFQEAQKELTAANTELEHQRAERVQLETLCASRADEIHKFNNRLTAVLLERDNAIRNGRLYFAKLEQLRKDVKALEATWRKLLEAEL
jgi:chromosome segregation ATPase